MGPDNGCMVSLCSIGCLLHVGERTATSAGQSGSRSRMAGPEMTWPAQTGPSPERLLSRTSPPEVAVC
jgi:hypothetical protein